MKIVKISDDFMGVNIYVGYGVKYKKFNDIIKKRYRVLNDVELPKMCDGISVELTDGWIIWVEKKDFSVLAHEALHVAQRVLEKNGINLCHETREVYAYYLTFILDKADTGGGEK